MRATDVTLAAIALVLLVIGFGGLIATADVEPCWPNCAEVAHDQPYHHP